MQEEENFSNLDGFAVTSKMIEMADLPSLLHERSYAFKCLSQGPNIFAAVYFSAKLPLWKIDQILHNFFAGRFMILQIDTQEFANLAK